MKTLLFIAAFSIAATIASGQTSGTISNIDQMPGWKSCGSCAGKGGVGPNTPRSLIQHVASPSMDGSAMKVSIAGKKAFSAALWWKQLGAKPSATHFVYDVSFYLQNPSAAQSLEFDANQSLNGKKYIFGTQCNVRGSHQWDIYSASKHWLRSGIGCSLPTAYKWHHLTWEFQRVGTSVKFVSVTYDGKKHYINKTYAAKPGGARELNIAVQLDGNRTHTAYSMWVDKASLKYW